MKIIANGLIHEGPLFTGMPGLQIELAVQTQGVAARYVNPPRKRAAVETGEPRFNWRTRILIQYSPARTTMNWT